MKNVVILHGIDGYAGIHWQRWLHDTLTKKGYRVFMPTLPNASHPSRTEWLITVSDILKELPGNTTTLIGHSLSVATALDYSETMNGKIALFVSVSGFGEDYGSQLNSYFMKEKTINFDLVKQHLEKAVVIYGDNDPYVPQQTLQNLAKNLDVNPTIIHNGGHMNTDAGFTKLPLLVDVIP